MRDRDGRLYCFYVVVLHATPARRHWEGIRVRRLLSPTEIDPASGDTRVIDPDSSWHANIVEAPTVLRAGNRWALLYSGGPCQRGQAVGVAYAPELMGPGGGADATWSIERARHEALRVIDPRRGEAWDRASLGSTCVARDRSGRLRVVCQGLNVAEVDAGGRAFADPSRAWTIGVDDLLVGFGRVRGRARR